MKSEKQKGKSLTLAVFSTEFFFAPHQEFTSCSIKLNAKTPEEMECDLLKRQVLLTAGEKHKAARFCIWSCGLKQEKWKKGQAVVISWFTLAPVR